MVMEKETVTEMEMGVETNMENQSNSIKLFDLSKFSSQQIIYLTSFETNIN